MRAKGIMKGIVSVYFSICVILLICGSDIQIHQSAAVQPYRFISPEGDSLYFAGIYEIQAWSDNYLIILDSFEDALYLLNTDTYVGRRVGREGGGPGEYRGVLGIGIKGDTLVVSHQWRTLYSLYLLPSLEFIRRLPPQALLPSRQVWEDEGTFLSTELPRQQFENGIWGRYSAEGNLIEVFGEFDPMKEYGSDRDLKLQMNDGYIGLLPNGNVSFAYSFRPIINEYTRSGELVAQRHLDMPWNDNQNPKPVKSRQTGRYVARSLISSFSITESGFLIAARGWIRREGVMQMYVARYDWSGNLTEIISLPRLIEPESTEGFLEGVIELKGELWIAVNDDPSIGKLIMP